MASTKIFILLGVFTTIFLFLSIIYTPVVDQILPADPFFFAANLSIFYWLSLASLLGLVLLRLTSLSASLTVRAKRMVDIFSIIVLVFLVYGAPCFSYAQPVYVDNYIHTSAALKLPLREHIPPSLSMMAASNSPGGYLLFSSVLVTTNLEPFIFMQYYPLFISSVLLVLLYVASLKFMGSDFAILSPFIFTAFRYGRMFHVYPGALAYVFFILFIIFFSTMLQRNDKKPSKLLILMLLLVSSSAITYVLGAPILIFVSLLPFFVYLFRWVPKINIRKLAIKSSLMLPVSFFLVWFSWLVFLAQGYFRDVFNLLQGMVMGDTSIKLPAAVSSSAFFSIRMLPLLLKNSSTIFLVLSGILLVFLLFRDAKHTLEKNQILLLGGSFIIFYSLLVLFLPISSDPLTRFNGFAVLPYCLLVPLYISKAKHIDVGPKLKKFRLNRIIPSILLITMVFFMFMVPVVRNDNDPGFFYPSSSLQGSNYAVENLKETVIFVKYHVHLMEFEASINGILLEGYMGIQQNDDVSFVSLSRWQRLNDHENKSASYFSKEAIKNCNAMVFNDYEDAQVAMLGDTSYRQARLAYEEDVSYQLNQVYSSGSIRIYAK